MMVFADRIFELFELGKINEKGNFGSMICFPNGKINLGLNVLNKRLDGYHNIESILYPVPLYDVLEIRPAVSFKLQVYGINLWISTEQNLIAKTWNLLAETFHIPPVDVHLLKNIPFGSGLGGGSADASFFLLQLNKLFSLDLNREELMELALKIGSDCPFFIDNQPAFLSGRGETIEPVEISLKGYYLILVFPDVVISTQNAYSNVSISKPGKSVLEIIKQPIETLKDEMVNDFEGAVFNEYPELKKFKTLLYQHGALFAAMTGSGSSIFGIFKGKPKNLKGIKRYWMGRL